MRHFGSTYHYVKVALKIYCQITLKAENGVYVHALLHFALKNTLSMHSAYQLNNNQLYG